MQRLVLVTITACLILFAAAKAGELGTTMSGVTLSGGGVGSSPASETSPCECEYSGTIKQMSMKPDLITVETTAGLIEFEYKHDGKQGCSQLADLKIGNNVRVCCKNMKDSGKKKNIIEAKCVTKITTGTSMTGGTRTGGSFQ